MKKNEPKDSLKILRTYGIRTATDLEQAYKAAEERCQVNELLSQLEQGKSDDYENKRFQIVKDTIKDDEWMEYIRKWRNTGQFSNKIFTINEIIEELRPAKT